VSCSKRSRPRLNFQQKCLSSSKVVIGRPQKRHTRSSLALVINFVKEDLYRVNIENLLKNGPSTTTSSNSKPLRSTITLPFSHSHHSVPVSSHGLSAVRSEFEQSLIEGEEEGNALKSWLMGSGVEALDLHWMSTHDSYGITLLGLRPRKSPTKLDANKIPVPPLYWKAWGHEKRPPSSLCDLLLKSLPVMSVYNENVDCCACWGRQECESAMWRTGARDSGRKWQGNTGGSDEREGV